MVQMTIKNVENEILILETTLDSNIMMAANGRNSSSIDASLVKWKNLKMQKERTLEEAKRSHEDLEFQLMELEAKYETELEDIQNRLIKEQDNLLNAFKQRQASLNDYDQQQTQLLMKVKDETEHLEMERQKLIEQFKKQRAQLQVIEKKMQTLEEQSKLNELSVEPSSGEGDDGEEESDHNQSQSPFKASDSSNSSDSDTSLVRPSSDKEKSNGSGGELSEPLPSPTSTSSTSSMTSGTTSSTPATPTQDTNEASASQQSNSHNLENSNNHSKSDAQKQSNLLASIVSPCKQLLSQQNYFQQFNNNNNNNTSGFSQTMTPNRISFRQNNINNINNSHNNVANNLLTLNQQNSQLRAQKLKNQLLLSANDLNNDKLNDLSFLQLQQQNYRKQMSQSFRDILENSTTLIMNSSHLNESNSSTKTTTCPFQAAYLTNYLSPTHHSNQTSISNLNVTPSKHIQSPNHHLILNSQHHRGTKCMNQSTSSLNSSMNKLTALSLNPSQQMALLNGTMTELDAHSPVSPSDNNFNSIYTNTTMHPASAAAAAANNKLVAAAATAQIPTTPILVNTQIALKFAELERSLALTKAENNTLLEQQLICRERELHLLQEEKRKREELELKLNAEIHLREKIVEENIKLRDKKHNQARPLTRYLPVRDHNFDLKQHVENSGHQLINQLDQNSKQPLVSINSNSCRGYLLKMGQKFKTWNKRWFVFDRQKRTLSYYMDRQETKLRGCIYFQSINEVYVDHMRTIKSPDQKSTFIVKTFDRNFYLVAPSCELMRIWVDVIFTGAEGYLEFYD